MAALDGAAEMLADRLMPKTYAEQRATRFGTCGNEVEADSGFVRRTGTGGDQDRVGAGGERVSCGQRVVALDAHVDPQLDQIMNEVEGEAVIIVDDEDHGLGRNDFGAVGKE